MCIAEVPVGKRRVAQAHTRRESVIDVPKKVGSITETMSVSDELGVAAWGIGVPKS